MQIDKYSAQWIVSAVLGLVLALAGECQSQSNYDDYYYYSSYYNDDDYGPSGGTIAGIVVVAFVCLGGCGGGL